MTYAHGEFYEIVVAPQIDEKRSEYFSGLDIDLLPSGESLLSGYVKDSAKLFSILNSIREMGLTLVSVNKKEHD